MKRILSAITTTLTAAILLFIAGCEQFSTTYQRVDDTEFRVLNFVYQPADAAPGDSVTLTAVFAGKNIDLDEQLEWWVSFNMIQDLFGSVTVVDSQLLRPIARRGDITFSPNTQTAAFRFKIPEDIVRNSASIPEVWTDMLPSGMLGMIPAEVASLTKGEMIDVLESFCGNNDAYPSIPRDIIDTHLPQLLQFFTVPIRISAKIREPGKLPHTIRSNHSVRYNSRITVTDVPINRNPLIDSVTVYKYRGDSLHDVILLDNSGNSVINVESGYSYFLHPYTSWRDQSITMDGNPVTERHFMSWQLQLDPAEAAGVHHSRYPSINNSDGEIMLPTDRSITKFTFWVTVDDEVVNERMRPRGSALKEVSGWFVYK